VEGYISFAVAGLLPLAQDKATFWRTFHHDGQIGPPPFPVPTITYNIVEFAPAKRADTPPPLFLLYPYTYSVVSTTTQHPLPSGTVQYTNTAQCTYSKLHGGSVQLETMPLNTSWSKFQEVLINALASSFLYGWGSSPFSSVTQFSSRANSLFVGLCGHLPGLPSYFSAPLKINWTLCKGGLKDSWEIYFICISFISFPLNCSATLNTKILSLLEGRRFINDMFVTLLHFASKRGHTDLQQNQNPWAEVTHNGAAVYQWSQIRITACDEEQDPDPH
jgi:hypothetical protein